MRATRIAAIAATTLVFTFSGCSCGDEPGGDGTDGGGNTGNDGAPNNNDGSTNPGEDGSSNGGDGSMVDGGNPLEQPLSDFCSGEGTVVTVSNTGDCAGELAENTFQFALCACETIEVQSNLYLDAFDSRLGTYGATLAMGNNIQDDGHLGLNGALNMGGKLTARGAAYVGGGGFSVGSQSLVTSTAYAAGDAVQENSSTTLGRNAYFSGNVVGRFEIAGDLHVTPTASVSAQTTVGGSIIREVIPAVRPCACEASEILDIGAITEFGRMTNDNAVITSTVTMETVLTSSRAYENGGPATLRLPCGRYYLTSIVQPGPLSIVAEGRTVLFVDGDFSIGGNFQLQLEPGAEVDIFVKGSLSVGASARFGDESQPSSVRTYVGGDGTIVLSASAIFGGNLYAPRAEVVFEASSNLYGSLFARRARFDGSADIHFDSAVRSAGDSCEEEMPVDDAGTPVDGEVSTDADTTDGAPPIDSGSPDAMGPTDGGDTPAPCNNDLDCPAPQVCVAGMCMIGL